VSDTASTPSTSDAQAGADTLLDAIVRRAAQLDEVGTAPLRRLRLRAGDTSVEVEWHAAGGPVPAMAPGGPVPDPQGNDPVAEGFPLSAPAVGTFYRAPEPDAPPFVNVGDVVSPGQQVGIIEAMKLMNPIEADRAGRVVHVAVGDGEPVEFGQTLLVLAPTEER
jgi:acetyl-CoA carboxylase biotin carboxyl carrier protein